MRRHLALAMLAATAGWVLPAPAAGPGPFHPKAAKVWDKDGRRMVWREECGNSPDHRVGAGYEWENDSRCFLAVGVAPMRGQRLGGVLMLSFPSGNVLHASWPVKFAKGQVWRIRFGLTDTAARNTQNGLKFTVTATNVAGGEDKVIEQVLKRGDRRVYDVTVRFTAETRKLTFTHDNLGSEIWDVLWMLPDGFVPGKLPPPGNSVAGPAPKPMAVATGGNAASLRNAIADLMQTFGSKYPNGARYLQQLDALAKAPDEKAFRALQKEALAANPLVSGQPILFVVRHQYRSHYHAVDTLFSTGEYNVDRNRWHAEAFRGGGALKTLDLSRGGQVKTLVNVPEGVARDPDVHWDGKRIVFAMRRRREEDYHIYEIPVGGRKPKPLTCAKGVTDFDPFYLPDDQIAFSSTREPKYNMCSRDQAANLFRMTADGANIHQIARNTLFDNHGEAMPDGRILYARWEYVDRNFGDAHGLWVVNPDGTNQAVFWGNNTAVPGAVFNAHVIPGTHRILCVFGPHHDRLWGALAIVDPYLGLDGREPVVRTWPAHVINTVRADGRFDCDANVRVRPRYEDPWPLSQKHFLCARTIDKGEQTGLFLVDTFGNEVLLHTEAPGCYDPMPLAPRPRPRVLAKRRDFQSDEGYVYMEDVYQGTHMKGVKPGAARYLRVVESPEKRHWARGKWNAQGYTAPGMNWHSLENKRILGTVPIESDGSAYFAVPAEKFVYFQVLDAEGRMIQSMRSGTVIQPGERLGCVGCHENRLRAPAGRRMLATRRAPSRLEGWHGKSRLFGFMAEVQPVFTKHCLTCHDYGKKGAAKLVLAPDRTIAFNTAYMELWRKGYVRCVGGGPAPVQQAYSWGSHASKLIHVLRKGHNKVKLSAEDRDRLITWVDLNAPYYATYACAYPENLAGRCPLTNEQLGQLGKLTGLSARRTGSHSANPGPLVSFDRPELSPCLARLAKNKNDPRYIEALAIIRAGKTALAQRPRADMPGFVPCAKDLEREKHYARRRAIEQLNRQAIRDGTKRYDDKQ